MQEILNAAEPPGAAPDCLDQAASKPINPGFGRGRAGRLGEQS
jgi:hypothetical protein